MHAALTAPPPRPLILLLLLAALQSVSAPDALDVARRRLEQTLVVELEALAERCRKDELYAERERVLALALTVDPERAEVRKALRYKLQEGRWVRAPGARPARDRGADEDLEAARAQSAALLAAHRAALLERLDALAAGLSPDDVEAALRRLTELQPDDPHVRARLGEVPLEGRWVLEETRRALERRAALAAVCARALDAAAPAACAPSPTERAGAPALAGRCTDEVRVLGTVPVEALERTARTAQALGPLFEAMLGFPPRYAPDFTIYVLASPREGHAFVQAWPGEAQGHRWLHPALLSAWIDREPRVAVWDTDARARLDMAARQAFGMLLTDALGIDLRTGWAWEGLGLYATHALLGTHLSWFLEERDYRGEQQEGALRPTFRGGGDWLRLAHMRLRGRGGLRLPFLLPRETAELGTEDLPVAFALAAYLVEGRPRELPELLARLALEDGPIPAFEETLGMPLPALERRLTRWLEETGHGSPPTAEADR